MIGPAAARPARSRSPSARAGGRRPGGGARAEPPVPFDRGAASPRADANDGEVRTRERHGGASSGHGSVKIAIAANVAIAVAKFVVASISSSGAASPPPTW